MVWIMHKHCYCSTIHADGKISPKQAKLVQYAERVWGITSGSDQEKALNAIELTREFFEKCK